MCVLKSAGTIYFDHLPNPEDMRQFLEASDRQGLFFEKTKHSFIDMLLGSVCTKFQVSIVFRLVRG